MYPINVKTATGSVYTLNSPTEYVRAAQGGEPKAHTCLFWGAAVTPDIVKTGSVQGGASLVFVVRKDEETIRIFRTAPVVEINGEPVGPVYDPDYDEEEEDEEEEEYDEEDE